MEGKLSLDLGSIRVMQKIETCLKIITHAKILQTGSFFLALLCTVCKAY